MHPDICNYKNMKMKYIILTLIQLCAISTIIAQSFVLEGTVFDNQNNRKLNNVDIRIIDDRDSPPILIATDKFGAYKVSLNSGVQYNLELERVAFENLLTTFDASDLDTDNVKLDLKMQRLPGYEFQADVRELISTGSNKQKVLGEELKNLKIEIYNNTSGKEIRVTEDDPNHTFEVNFERNNHYTILLRKKGYFAKRIEVNVDIFGCILCFEGLGNDFAPEIESATDGKGRGLLIADIPMKKIVKDETIRIDNIYYDYDKWNIRADAKPALDNLVRILRRNPIIIELGSHTDNRGTDEYNQELSNKRAKSAVDYIISRGIKPSRIVANGYGESVPLNRCTDDVRCTDEEYQFNRRTEFKVTGFLDATNFDKKSLKQILEEEKISKKRLKEQIEGI